MVPRRACPLHFVCLEQPTSQRATLFRRGVEITQVRPIPYQRAKEKEKRKKKET